MSPHSFIYLPTFRRNAQPKHISRASIANNKRSKKTVENFYQTCTTPHKIKLLLYRCENLKSYTRTFFKIVCVVYFAYFKDNIYISNEELLILPAAYTSKTDILKRNVDTIFTLAKTLCLSISAVR
jgi:hypothetical protein